MHNTPTPEQPDISQGYETRDVSLSVLVKWLIGLVIFTTFGAVSAFALYTILTPSIKERGSYTGMGAQIRPLPQPMLQSNPARDMRDFRADEESAIAGTVKNPDGTERSVMPLSDAMKIRAAGDLSAPVRGSGGNASGQMPAVATPETGKR